MQSSHPPIAHRPDIDGLRAVAVLLVVGYHLAPLALPGGYSGVDVFFVISGFLITVIVANDVRQSRFTLAGFYLRRARRILPALLAMLAAVFAYAWFFLLPSDFAATSRTAFASLFFLSNVELWKTLTGGYFAADGRFNPLLHTWSLGVEEQFYLLFPLLLAAGLRQARKPLPWGLAALALASFAAQATLSGSHPVALFFLAPFRAWELLLGALLALCQPFASPGRRRALAMQGAGLLAIGAAQVFPASVSATLPVQALAALGATCVIGGGWSDAAAWPSRLLALGSLRYVGRISYSLYLWHVPLAVLYRLHSGGAPIGRAAPGLFLASLALAALSYHLVERPFRERASARVLVAGACVATLVLACVAGAGIRTRGFPGRVDEATLGYDGDRYESIITFACSYAEGRCVLGDATHGASTLLFLGDSHLLFWGPAIAQELAKQHRSAWFLVETGCAPLFASEAGDKASRCAVQDAAAQRFLAAHPEVRTVVLGAYWRAYSDPRSGFAVDAARFPEALRETLRGLLATRRDVAVIGDVPGYQVNVPLALALARRDGKPFSEVVDAKAAYAADATFRATLAPFERQGVIVADPIAWMCSPRCEVEDGASHYRDANHLTRAGAMRYAGPMGDFLGKLGRRAAEGPPTGIRAQGQ